MYLHVDYIHAVNLCSTRRLVSHRYFADDILLCIYKVNRPVVHSAIAYLLEKRFAVAKLWQNSAVEFGRSQHVDDVVLVALAVHDGRSQRHRSQHLAIAT